VAGQPVALTLLPCLPVVPVHHIAGWQLLQALSINVDSLTKIFEKTQSKSQQPTYKQIVPKRLTC
jgi:hypothetical protein